MSLHNHVVLIIHGNWLIDYVVHEENFSFLTFHRAGPGTACQSDKKQSANKCLN